MRPLPRLHAVTDGAVLALEDLPVRAAALAAIGLIICLITFRKSGGNAAAVRA